MNGLLLSYLKYHRKTVIVLAVFVLIFIMIAALYELPIEAIGYAVLLCTVAVLALFAFSYSGYVRRHCELTTLQQRINVSLNELPTPCSLPEYDYQQLLRLMHAELTSVTTRAEAYSREQVDYYTMWAHQIKTPIAAMRLLLQEQANDDNTALSAELFRIEQYVEMVLSYARLDSDSSDLLLREYELDDIIRQAVRKYARLFITKKLPLRFTETHKRVLTDEKWLLFVIEQLLSNALKYTSSGYISIYAKGDTLVISDTGIGIKSEDLPRVFEKGFTGFNGRAEKKSTGIGLYLCRRVCHQLGHNIGIDSAPGQGTQVSLDLSAGDRVIE